MAKGLKRIVDLVVSLILLVLVGPVMLIIAIAVVWDSPGEVFFRQTRAGLRRREFKVIKFRSMKHWGPGESHVTSSNDPRVTRVGRFLRQRSLDELPQLINVLKGDMSLVGPRPLLLESIRPEEMVRLEMRPGVTGLVAVSGRQSLPWDRRMMLDCWYVQNWNIWLDVRILLRTIPVVLSQANVYDADGEAKARS